MWLRLVRHYNWVVLIFCVVDGIAWRLNLSILPPLLPLIIQEFKMSYLEAGLLNTSTMVAYCLLQYPIGYLADRIGRRNVMVLGQVWSATICILICMANGFIQLLLLLVVLGVGNGMHFIPGSALISDVFSPEKRSKALSISFSSSAISMLIALLMAVPLGELFGWRFPFFVVGAFEVGVAVAFWLVVKEPKREALRRGISREGLVTAKNLKLSVVAHLTGYTMAVLNFVPTFLRNEFGLSLYQAGLVSMAASVSLIISSGSGLSGLALGKLKARRSILFSGILAFSITAALGVVSDITTMIILLLLHGVMRSMMVPAILNYAVTVTRPETRASEMGFINTLWVMGSVIGPSLIGMFTDVSGFSLAFLALSTAPLFSMVITMTLPKDQQD